MLYKNVAGQKVYFYAHDLSAGLPKTGDANNITAQISKDGGASGATDDVNPSELDAVNHKGVYYFNLLQAETNCEMFVITPVSSTVNVQIFPIMQPTSPITPTMAGYLDAAITTRAPEAAGNLAAVKADVEHATYGLNALLTAIGTRMATFTYTAPDSAATIATAVWASATRTLSNFGELVADIATAVWGAGTKALTDKAGFSLSGTKQTLDALHDAIQGATAEELNAAELAIRGDEGDTLKTLSAQLDTAQADLDDPSQYKATGFATPANVSDVQTAIINALPSVADLALQDTLTAGVTALSDLINTLNNIAAADVWAVSSRTLSGDLVDLDALALALQGADGDTLKNISDQIDAIDFSALQAVLVGLQARLLTSNQPFRVTLDGTGSPKVIFKQGEARTFTLAITDGDGNAVNLSAATLLLGVKARKTDAAYAFSKLDAVFNKAQAAAGIVSVVLSATDTNQPEGTYIGELKCSWTGPPAVVDKSADFYIQVKAAVTT